MSKQLQEQSESELIAEAMLPILSNDTNKGKYLALRALNFAVEESAQLVGVTLATIFRWRRDDPKFNDMDTEGISEARKKVANEFLAGEFVRNFHLALQKDMKVLMKAALEQPMTETETEYLLKIRPQYTPQQLGVIKQLAGEVDSSNDMDFTKLTMVIRREREEIMIQKEH